MDVGSSVGTPVLEVTLCAEAGSLIVQVKRHPEDAYGVAALAYSDVIAFGRIVLEANSQPTLVMPSFQTTSGDGLAIFTSLPNSWSVGPESGRPDKMLFEFDRDGTGFRFEAELPDEVGSFVAQQVRTAQSPLLADAH